MVGYIVHDYDMVMRNITKVRTVAKAAGASSVLITGKGEPLLHLYGVIQICDHFSDFPLDLQTNGLWLNKNPEAVKELKKSGIDVIALSVDRMDQIPEFENIYEAVHSQGLTVRICLNLTDKIPKEKFPEFRDVLKVIGHYPVDQLLVRNVMVPKKTECSEAALKTIDWVTKHTDQLRYKLWNTEFMEWVTEDDLVRVMSYGARVYDLDDLSVSFSDYCIQEANNTKDIRSLIFLEDGHLYTSWDKKSSRQF